MFLRIYEHSTPNIIYNIINTVRASFLYLNNFELYILTLAVDTWPILKCLFLKIRQPII